MAELIDQAIAYARVEEDKEAVRPIFDAAENYIINAIEQKDKAENEKNPIFCLAVEMLFAHWYDNRGAVGETGTLPFGLQSLIAQLTYSTPSAAQEGTEGI
ncbi:phage gp6-like head-tail connector protein [Caproiciproducens galactitolivorans]|uniref:Phage gp6-like head-tail connector protein n=1 Tax=Caproiciproducens galactitolivorans TaxID=642589 RepID=A0A4Z0Y7A4_9FIRM|nr:head-tail connector protein [Caproiciproducens galactitolivorans]QEY34620.1 phage gp6-like head-tail connector protein [Caproiciproducens galactitolivorans]TGJ75415.1 phage gp6-like head-tail connector protein [Caproiciproducens galactitolivorans]